MRNKMTWNEAEPTLLSILFAFAETFGAIPVPEAVAVAVPDAVADALADVDSNANANLYVTNTRH